MRINSFVLLITLLAAIGCQIPKHKKMETTQNPLLCDPETGRCEIPEHQSENHAIQHTVPSEKVVNVVYFTDPICSSCWGIEPQLRKLKLEYGDHINIDYRMGGLLPNWSYNSGGISKPSDVATHWDEVSSYYDMPIDGDVWLEDPLDSSYPPSIAFKAAQIQSHAKAKLFLRYIREMVFLEKKNITKWEYLKEAAQKAGLDIDQFKQDFNGKAKQKFDEDLSLSKEYGVRGFPTLFFLDSNGQKEIIYGSRPYAFFETAVLKVKPDLKKHEYRKDWETLFSHYPSLTAKEFSELSGMPRTDVEAYLNQLVTQKSLNKSTTKNGDIWWIR